MTKELDLWKGQFGDDYIERNKITDDNLNNRISFWEGMIVNVNNMTNNVPKSFYEHGTGVGGNMLALDRLYQKYNETVELRGYEPNEKALKVLNAQGLRDYKPAVDSDRVHFAFSCGVLIHVNPDNQLAEMKKIYEKSTRYIGCMEYFSKDVREVNYHGEQAMWTRDYGSLWLDNFPVRALCCVFAWKRLSGLDDLTGWVFEKVH